MSRVIVIPAERLGVLEYHFRDAWALKLKSHRKGAFTRLVRVLKDLGMIEKKADVLGLASGLGANGELNAYVICNIDQRQGGEVGPMTGRGQERIE